MANTNTPFGFKQVKGTGSLPTFEQNVRYIAPTNSTAIFFGDAVIPLNTGYIAVATAAAVRMEGIFAGCKYTSVSQKRTVWSNYWPGSDANGDVEAYIIDDPNAQFQVQATSGPITFTSVGRYAQLTAGTGNTATGISAMTLATPSAGTITFPFIVKGLVQDPPGANGTDITTAYNIVVVGFNNASTRTNGAGPVGLT